MHPGTFIVVGPSGSGKGTQVELLKGYLADKAPFPVELLEMGDLFREFWGVQSYTQDRSRAVMERGDLQPAFLQIYLWADFLIEHDQPDRHLILDGSPRRLTDAVIMDQAFAFYKREKPFFISLTLPRDVARERLLARAQQKSGRQEDRNAALVERRLDWYDKEVVPAIHFFRDNPRYRFIEIDGNAEIAKVHQDIVKALEQS